MEVFNVLETFCRQYPDFRHTLNTNPPRVTIAVYDRGNEFITFLTKYGIPFTIGAAAGRDIIKTEINY